jgi:hypothetical protein
VCRPRGIAATGPIACSGPVFAVGGAVIAGLGIYQIWWLRRVSRSTGIPLRQLTGVILPAATDPAASFTCPKCGMTSYNKDYIEQGYCGELP